MADYKKGGGYGSKGGYRGDSQRPSFKKKEWSAERGPVEMHKATCAECRKTCDVPFRPTAGKPVYCKDCFVVKGGRDSRIDDRFPRKDFATRSGGDKELLGDNTKKAIQDLGVKIDKLMALVERLAESK